MKKIILVMVTALLFSGSLLAGCSKAKPVDDNQVVKHTPGEAVDDSANGQAQPKTPK